MVPAPTMPNDPVRKLAAPNFNFIPALTATLVHIWSRRGNDCEHTELFVRERHGASLPVLPGSVMAGFESEKGLEAAASNYTAAS